MKVSSGLINSDFCISYDKFNDYVFLDDFVLSEVHYSEPNMDIYLLPSIADPLYDGESTNLYSGDFR